MNASSDAQSRNSECLIWDRSRRTGSHVDQQWTPRLTATRPQVGRTPLATRGVTARSGPRGVRRALDDRWQLPRPVVQCSTSLGRSAWIDDGQCGLCGGQDASVPLAVKLAAHDG